MKIKSLKALKKKLPAVPGILRKEDFFNSAVLIPLVPVGDEYYLLFEKRAAKIRQGGEICFPGGEIDKTDRDVVHTAVRETVEELGVKENVIEVVGKLDTLVGPMRVTVDSVVAILNIKNILELPFDKDEVEKVFLFPLSFFENKQPEKYKLNIQVHSSITDEKGNDVELFPVKELNLPEKYHKPWNAGRANVLVYRTDEGTIWGITALLIYELVRKLGENNFDK